MGIPYEPDLRPLLFNLFINDLLLFNPELCNFANDHTIQACEEILDKVDIKLEHNIQQALLWFRNNFLIANPLKSQVIHVLGLNDKHNICLKIDDMNNVKAKIR